MNAPTLHDTIRDLVSRSVALRAEAKKLEDAAAVLRGTPAPSDNGIPQGLPAQQTIDGGEEVPTPARRRRAVAAGPFDLLSRHYHAYASKRRSAGHAAIAGAILDADNGSRFSRKGLIGWLGGTRLVPKRRRGVVVSSVLNELTSKGILGRCPGQEGQYRKLTDEWDSEGIDNSTADDLVTDVLGRMVKTEPVTLQAVLEALAPLNRQTKRSISAAVSRSRLLSRIDRGIYKWR